MMPRIAPSLWSVIGLVVVCLAVLPVHAKKPEEMILAREEIPEDLLTDDLVAEVQVERQRYIDTERHALLQVRPDLNDSAKWSGLRSMLVDHLAPYGFRDVEIDQIVDHRLAKYVIDNAEREKRVRELQIDPLKGTQALTGAKPQPVGGKKRATKKAGRRRGPKITGASPTRDKTAAVAQLIGEQNE